MMWLVWLGAAHAACLAVVGAQVHAPAGIPAVATVVAVDGRIAAVGATVAGLDGDTYRGKPCARVDGVGKELTAGLVAVPTRLGLVEIELEPASRDDDPHTDDAIRAALVVADAYDPRSVVGPIQRVHGITMALTSPAGGFIAGQAAMVVLTGDTQASAVRDRDAAMVATVPTESFADGVRQLRELIDDVKTHARNPALYDQGRPYFPGASRRDLEALRPVAEGRLPLLLSADRASDLEVLAGLKRELGIDLVIVGAAEGWLVADVLAAAKVPVIVDALVFGPQGFDSLRTRADNAARLAKAGVPLMLHAGAYEAHNVRTLRQVAGNAVREGLPHADAIRAITETPARVFGQGDAGKVAVGARADLVLWSGDPLELSTRAEHVWIDGVEVSLENRQSGLRDRYRTLPGTPIVPLPPRP